MLENRQHLKSKMEKACNDEQRCKVLRRTYYEILE